MCDTLIHGQWFAKNSDREPGEPQTIEVRPAASHDAEQLACTYVKVPQVAHTNAVILSRPVWMWGAEIGVNEHGVAIGNEAVFTRIPVADSGLTGMDLVRLGLERASTAADALEVVTTMLAEHGQGGNGGYRNPDFRYHNSFIIADASEAWVLETADRFWAAQRVDGPRTISNVLSIGADYDRLAPGTIEYAVERGWAAGVSDFTFAGAFADPFYREMSGGEVRAQCTNDVLRAATGPGRETMFAALRTHGSESPTSGWRSMAPCAHASWLPTRHAAQTTGSLVADLSQSPPLVWATGTSAPCISVFKPVAFEPDFDFGPAPGEQPDDSLWWHHERLHRAVLAGYEERRAVFEQERLRFEEGVVDEEPSERHWQDHRELTDVWRAAALSRRIGAPLPSRAFWWWQSRRDGLR